MRVELKKGSLLKSQKRDYVVEKILGIGGCAITYLCVDSKNKNLKYAIKEIFPKELERQLTRKESGEICGDCFSDLQTSAKFNWYKENLYNEYSVAIEVDNIRGLDNNDPFFLKCVDIFNYNNTVYMVTETKNGITLFEYLAEHKGLRFKDSREYLAQVLAMLVIVAKKLSIVHEKYYHLDITPNNIYLIDTGESLVKQIVGGNPFFLDFGSAFTKNKDNTKHRFSVSQGYSAPELFLKSKGGGEGYRIDESADTYSIVAILYEALIGKVYDDPLGLYKEERNNALDIYPLNIREDLNAIFDKGLNSEPWERFDSAKSLADALLIIRSKITDGNNDINILLLKFEKISSHLTQINDGVARTENEIKETKNTVKTENRKTIKAVGALGACLLIAVLTVFAVVSFCDFKPPTVQLIGVKTNDDGFIEIGTSIEICFQFTDDNGIKYQDVSENDIILDGIECEKHLEKNNGFYKLTLMNIRKTSDMPKLVIKEGCAEDYSKNKNIETIYMFSFANSPSDRTVPTLGITHPVSKDGNDYIKAGSDIVLSLWLSDNNNVAIENVVPEYIQAVGFSYQDMTITGSNGEYSITIKNIQGTTGKYHIYIAPGIAIDDENNYSFGVKSRDFYLYNDSDEIDKSDPVLTISAPEIYDSTVEYYIAVNDNVGVSSFNLTKDHITPIGFSADIDIEYVATSSGKDSVRLIKFTNIQSTSNSNKKYFIVNSGVATDNFDNRTKAKISPSFSASD